MLTFVALVAGCTALETREPAVETKAFEHSTHEADQPPEPAAACIVRNAKGAGYATVVQPLYGTAAMAVRVRTLVAGGNPIASLSIMPAGRGSEVTVTTLRDASFDRNDVVTKLLAGC